MSSRGRVTDVLLGEAYHLLSPRGETAHAFVSLRFSSRAPLRPDVNTGARLAKKASMPSSMSAPVKTRWLSANVRVIASCVVWLRESRTPAADEAQREGGATSQHLGESNSGGQGLPGRREAVDETNAMRLVCVDRFAGVEQLVSLGRTDKPGKPEDAAASREDAQFHLGKTDTRSFVHDAN